MDFPLLGRIHLSVFHVFLFSYRNKGSVLFMNFVFTYFCLASVGEKQWNEAGDRFFNWFIIGVVTVSYKVKFGAFFKSCPLEAAS